MRLALRATRALIRVLLYGALIFGGAFSFAYYATRTVFTPASGKHFLGPSQAATVVLAGLQRQERLTPRGCLRTTCFHCVHWRDLGPLGRRSVPVLLAMVVLRCSVREARSSSAIFRPSTRHWANAVGMATGAAILVALTLF